MKYEDLLKTPGVRSVVINSGYDVAPTINMEMDYSTLNILERSDIIQIPDPQYVISDSAAALPGPRLRYASDTADASDATCTGNLTGFHHLKPIIFNADDLMRAQSVTQRMVDDLKRLTKKENNMIVHVKSVPMETVGNKGVFMSKACSGITLGGHEGECLTVKSIIYNNPATIVFWSDGTKTVVKRLKGTPFNKYNAFCAAVCKKLYGSNNALNKIVNSGIDQTKKKKIKRVKKAGKKNG